MLQYVNSFACTMNKEQKNFIIHFRQNEPRVPEDENDEVTFIPNDIINIIMDEDCAKNLAESILRVFSSEDENN